MSSLDARTVTRTPRESWLIRRTIVPRWIAPFSEFAAFVASRSLPPGIRENSVVAGIVVRRELVDERDERELLGIGKEESAHPAHARNEERVRR